MDYKVEGGWLLETFIREARVLALWFVGTKFVNKIVSLGYNSNPSIKGRQ